MALINWGDNQTLKNMGKGDKKTRKGKIAKGTFGVSRPKKKKTDHKPPVEEKKERSKK